ncbi:unnamed protein product, partial [Allacma fusca]
LFGKKGRANNGASEMDFGPSPVAKTKSKKQLVPKAGVLYNGPQSPTAARTTVGNIADISTDVNSKVDPRLGSSAQKQSPIPGFSPPRNNLLTKPIVQGFAGNSKLSPKGSPLKIVVDASSIPPLNLEQVLSNASMRLSPLDVLAQTKRVFVSSGEFKNLLRDRGLR